jgi:hypothetical protein
MEPTRTNDPGAPAPAPPSSGSRLPVALAGVGFLATAALSVAVRATGWAAVFTARGVRFNTDGDPYYHVRRAWLILEQGGAVWRDPWLNYPAGSEILWPPLFDLLLAGPAWLLGLGHPTQATLAAVAAWVPLVLGVATVALVALLAAELFGRAVALPAAFLSAVSVPSIIASQLGRPDHHVLEVLLFAAVLLAFARALRAPALRLRHAALVGVLLALSFWTWPGSPLTLAVLGAWAAADHVRAPPGDPGFGRAPRLLAASGAAAAALLFLSIGLAGPPRALARLELGGISAFQPIACAVCALLAGALLLARARSRLARAALAVAIPAALAALLLAALPALRAPIVRGLTAARGGNAWYGTISEFQPLVGSGVRPLRQELLGALGLLGLVPLLALLGAADAVARLRAGSERAAGIVGALATLALLSAASVSMIRFIYYGAVPLCLLGALGVDAVRRGAARWRGWLGPAAAGAVALGAAAPTWSELFSEGPTDAIAPQLEGMLLRIRAMPAQGDRRAVLSWWDIGHHVLYHSERPVLATPFGIDAGRSSMEDLARFFTESDPTAAERLLDRRGVQFVLLDDPWEKSVLILGHGVRAGTEGFVSGRANVLSRPGDLVIVRLIGARGSATGGAVPRPALDAFRIVDEVPSERGPARLFEVVPGVELAVRGARAGARVTAAVTLQAPSGELSEWWTYAPADGKGNARLRLPFATGRNGRYAASAWTVTDGSRRRSLETADEQVLAGARSELDLGAPPR